MLLHWSKNLDVPTSTIDEEDGRLMHQEWCLPWLPFLLESVVLNSVPPVNFLPPWQPSGLGSRWGFFGEEAPQDSGTGQFWTLNWNKTHLDNSIVQNVMNLGKLFMHLQSCNHTTIRTLKRGNSISQSSPCTWNKLLCVWSGMSSCTNANLKARKTD